jgi:hypothetical protein
MRIISIHMPKAGGLTFRNHLEYIYGKKNVFYDYTHCGHPDYKNTPPPAYILKKLRRPKKTTIIHGHFLIERYTNIPGVHFVCWMRDPIERLLSHYYYWLRAPDYNHPYCLKLVEDGLSVVEFAKLMPDIFTKRFAPLDIDDFSFIGLTDKYIDSLRLFYDMFCPSKMIKTDIHENRNFARDTDEYRLNRKQRTELEKINKQDIDLYQKAIERFELLKEKYQGGF